MPATSPKSSTALTRRSINAARARYERGETIVAIAAALKIGQSTIRRYMRDENWTRAETPAPQPSAVADATGQAAKKKPPPKAKSAGVATMRSQRRNSMPEPERNACAAADSARGFYSGRQSALIDRIWRAAEKQVEAIERRIGVDESGSSERDARALAVMTRMLRELATLTGGEQGADVAPAPEDDDDLDRDIDECRAKLARILQGLREPGRERSADSSGDAAPSPAENGDGLAVSGEGGSVSA